MDAGVSGAEVAAAWASVVVAGERLAGARSCPPEGAAADSGAGLEAAEEDESSLTLSTGLVLARYWTTGPFSHFSAVVIVGEASLEVNVNHFCIPIFSNRAGYH